MIKVRKHPNDTWTAPYRNEELDEASFAMVESARLAEVRGKDVLFDTSTGGSGTGGRLRLRFCTNRILRITWAPDGCFPSDSLMEDMQGPYGITRYDWDGLPATAAEIPQGTSVAGGDFRVGVDTRPFRIQVSDPAGRRLLRTEARGLGARGCDGGYETLSFFEKAAEDRFFGFGGRIHRLDRTGSTADLFATKVELERGDYGGFPVPYFLNPAGYGFLLDNPWPHVYFDLGRELADRWFLHTPGGFLDFYVLSGPSFAEIGTAFCELTGFPVLPPKWNLGFWVSWASPYHRVEEHIEIAERLRREGWPFDVMVADMHWRGGDFNIFLEGDSGNNLDWHPRRFGDGKDLIRVLRSLDAHLCLHLNTVMYTGELLEEGLRTGALRHVQKGVTVPRVDDRAAVDWYWDTHKGRVEEGVDLWWTDNGERVEGTLGSGLPSRNLFGHLWNKALFSRMAEAGKPDRLVLSRGGWMGAQRFTLTWPGDTGPGVERLKEDLRWHLNCSISGIPYNTVDLGGFMVRSKYFMHEKQEWFAAVTDSSENIARRVADGMLLFTVPRVHGTAKLPWDCNEETARIWKFFLHLRYRLFPYLWSFIVRSALTGEPPYRPLPWHHQHDEQAWGVDDELYCGDAILFAPVVEEGCLEREVYLPEGAWIDFWTGERFCGPRRIVADAPFFEPAGLPFYVRQGAILPMRPLSTHNAEEDERELQVHLFPGPSVKAACRATFHDSRERAWSVSCVPSREGLAITVGNPLDVSRSILLVVHDGEPQITMDSAAPEFPFASGFRRASVELAPGETRTARIAIS